MKRIFDQFTQYFAQWEITLPAEDVEKQQPGTINAQGWTIKYQFGRDGRGQFLDFYATHRMTNDRHVRLYATGESEHLPSYQEFVVYPADANEQQKSQIEHDYYAYNQGVTEALRRKGFL